MKSKGCLILGYIAAISGYVLGVATAVRRMLSGISAQELLTGAEIFFPSYSPLGILSLTGITLMTVCSGLSATGIAFALPCAAVGTYIYGLFSAATLAAYGADGLKAFLWAAPLMAAAVILLARASGEALRYSFFTLRRLGLITEAKGQYAEQSQIMDIPRYVLSSCVAMGISLMATLYGHLAVERIFSP